MIDAVIDQLAPALKPVVRFAYITGWRVESEVLPLEWNRVDLAAGEVRLGAGTTKNGQARIIYVGDNAALTELLRGAWADHEALKAKGTISAVGLPAGRRSDQEHGRRVARRLQAGRSSWPPDARPPAIGGAESGARRRG